MTATQPPRRIRILQLQPECHDRSHDSTDLAEQIVSAFPRQHYEVTSAFLQGRPVAGQPQSAAEHVHYFELPDEALRGLRIRLHRTLWNYCREGGFDVVVCNRYKPVSTLMTLNRWLRIPVCIGISHGIGEYDRFWRRSFVAAMISPHWRFVGVSPTVRDHLISLGCGFSTSNTVGITNALDIDAVEAMLLPRTAARAELGLPENCRLIGAIGRLVPVKGHIHLVRAFGIIAARYPDAHLAIIGEGNEDARLREEARQWGISDRLHLLGWRTRAKRYVRAFDIWTMPSLREGLGLALLEGMCGRLPVIASDVPAMRPLIEGAGGLAVPPKNETALAEALAQYLALAPEALARLGEATFAYVRSHHDIADYQRAYRDLIDTALRENSK
jgi:glycosyltransferase involved in cell wall biosynthesis